MKMSRNIIVVGVFDLFHVGHLNILERSKELGEFLLVVINGDKLTLDYKKKTPNINEHDRARIIRSLSCADKVVISNEYNIKPYLEKYNIDKIVHGDDWSSIDSYLKQIRVTKKYLNSKKIELVFLPHTPEISTSILLKEIKMS